MAYTDTYKIPMLIVKLVSTTAFLVNLVGWKSLLPGVVASVLAIPLTTILTNKYGSVQSQQMKHRDQRVALIKDALLAIRQLNLSTAETIWERKIFQARNQELRQLFKSAIWMCSLVFAANIGPVLLAGIPIYLFALRNKQLNAPVAFTCIDLFQQLQSDLAILPLTSTYFSEALMSLRRLEIYFAEREVMETQILPSATVSCEGATMAWFRDVEGPQQFVLKDVSLEFPDGQLSVVTGETGSGKSLLLSVLAGEATILAGKVRRPSKKNDVDTESNRDMETNTEHDCRAFPHPLAIVSQSPWMENTTIRDNILFGLPMDKQRYLTVLRSCALDTDLDALKNGDATLVGLNGVALSGGQRWRVALARALYSEAKVILLEDILSAVDAEVRGWLVDEAICGELAKGRTRIVVTHHATQCQAKATYMLRLHGGKVKEQRRLSPTASSLSTKVEQENSSHNWERGRRNTQGPGDKTAAEGNGPTVQTAAGDVTPNLSEKNSTRSSRVIKPEQRRQTSWSLYKAYFRTTGGTPSWFFVAVIITTYELLIFTKSWWLKDWILYMQQARQPNREAADDGGDPRVVFYGATYLLISCLSCLATAARCFIWYVLGMTASTSLFEKMTRSVFGSPLEWLEGTPHGEIMTRFTSDINTVDQRLPHDVGYMVEQFMQIVSIVLTR